MKHSKITTTIAEKNKTITYCECGYSAEEVEYRKLYDEAMRNWPWSINSFPQLLKINGKLVVIK